MKSLGQFLAAFPIFLNAATASAQVAPPVALEVSPRYMQPCGFWRLDSASFDYVCGYLEREVEYYDARAVDTLVADLQSKVAALEARLEALEAKATGED